MPEPNQTVSPGPSPQQVVAGDGNVLDVPPGWSLLPPGDAALTRRVKAAGPSWTVQEKRGRKTFSRGVWAPANLIAAIRTELERERSTESYQKRLAAGRRRREQAHRRYVQEFQAAVKSFLNFDPCYQELEDRLAAAVTRHATPIGSGTVARTRRLPIERRAESAVIAWLRHQTTAYDTMRIPREKGKRRDIRRLLAQHSRNLLETYRRGEPVAAAECLLTQALDSRTQDD